MKKTHNTLYVSVFEGIWFYAFIVWLYIAIENLIYPSLVFNSNFSSYIPIKTNLLGIIAFVISFIFYVLWRFYRYK